MAEGRRRNVDWVGGIGDANMGAPVDGECCWTSTDARRSDAERSGRVVLLEMERDVEWAWRSRGRRKTTVLERVESRLRKADSLRESWASDAFAWDKRVRSASSEGSNGG